MLILYCFILLQLLNELSYPFHLTKWLSNFFRIDFSILNSVWLVFCNFFSQIIPTISSQLWSLITDVSVTGFFTSLIQNLHDNLGCITSHKYFCILMFSHDYKLVRFVIMLDIEVNIADFQICIGTWQLPRLLLRKIWIFFNVHQQILAKAYCLYNIHYNFWINYCKK